MNNTNLFHNSDLGLGATASNTTLFPSAAQEVVNTELFPATPVAVNNTELFPAQESGVVNTTLFAAVEEVTEDRNDVAVQFGHLSDLLLLEGYTNLSDAVLSLSDIYTSGV